MRAGEITVHLRADTSAFDAAIDRVEGRLAALETRSSVVNIENHYGRPPGIIRRALGRLRGAR